MGIGRRSQSFDHGDCHGNVDARLLDLVVAKNRYGEVKRRICLLLRPKVGDFASVWTPIDDPNVMGRRVRQHAAHGVIRGHPLRTKARTGGTNVRQCRRTVATGRLAERASPTSGTAILGHGESDGQRQSATNVCLKAYRQWEPASASSLP
jgi:hypothetical protein